MVTDARIATLNPRFGVTRRLLVGWLASVGVLHEWSGPMWEKSEKPRMEKLFSLPKREISKLTASVPRQNAVSGLNAK